MSWLFPGCLAGALLIALPVILHLLRRRENVRIHFPSLRFLQETALRDTRRQQLFRWITLLLRCLAIALIAGAFARPFWMKPEPPHGHLMLVAMDNSMSMQASGRLEILQGWALKQLDELKPGDQAALLIMNPVPVLLVPWTDDLNRVRTALKNTRPGFEKTHYAGALQSAGETLSLSPGARKTLVWMADEQRAGWRGVDFAQPLPPGVKIRFAETAVAPARQAAITSMQWLPDQKGLEVNVRLFAPPQARRQITVRGGDRILADKAVTLRAGDNKISLSFAPVENVAGFQVALDPDDLTADDTAWIAACKPAKDRVLLDAVEDTDFLAHALRATQKLGAAGLKVDPLPENHWPANSVAILRTDHAFHPPQVESLDRFFDAGGALLIFVDGSSGQLDWLKKRGVDFAARKPSEQAWNLRDWDSEHPALAAFAGQSLLPLLCVEFRKGFDLAGSSLAPIADWPDGKMALAEWSDGGHRLLLAGFPINRGATDWPIQSSFVPFVHQAVRWLGMFNDRQTDWRIGDTIPLPVAKGIWRVLDGPAVPRERNITEHNVRPDAPGLYQFSSGGTQQVFAVNIPAEESDLAPWPKPEQFAALESKISPTNTVPHATASLSKREDVENQQRLWWWILAACGLILLAELTFANRSVI